MSENYPSQALRSPEYSPQEESSRDSPLPLFLQDAPRADLADFIASHLQGLRAMALAANWPEMVYYLEMAITEAKTEAEARNPAPPPSPPSRPSPD